jgi:thiamine-phosphate pyrophosphorylase
MKPDVGSVRLAVLVADGVSRLPFATLVREVVAGGADMIQLREKNIPDSILLEHARICRDVARDVLFIVNDRPDIAVLSNADGVHVGQLDLPCSAARQIVGLGFLVGVSVYTLDELAVAQSVGADYLGVGAVFPTGTKDAPVSGLEFVAAAARLAKVPLIAIGGINRDNVASVVASGARAVAVFSAVIAADDPRAAARSLKDAVLSALR